MGQTNLELIKRKIDILIRYKPIKLRA